MLLTYTHKARLIPSWLQAVPLAILTTFSLLFFMERLIAMADVTVDETEAPVIKNVVWEEPHPIVTKIDRIEKQVAPVEPPVIPENIGPIETGSNVTIPTVNIAVAKNDFTGISFDSRMPLAKLMSTPVYPRGALNRGIEGFVDVRFDVNEIGMTENIQIIGANPVGVFEKAAVAAVKKWKFQPSVYNGKPERFEGMSKRVRFEMKKT